MKITTAYNNATIDVRVTSSLQGGSIDSRSVIQILNVDSIPINLYCSKARGGNCMPSYKYQWQESKDNISYKDIKGEEMENRMFSKEIKHTAYYRRKVTETLSSSTAYSNTSTIIVPLEPAKK